MKIGGYAIIEKKLSVICDCGAKFLHSVVDDLFRCPACGLISHRKFFYSSQRTKPDERKDKGDS